MSGAAGSQNKALVDKLLTNVSNAYIPENLIAEKILPNLPVSEDSGILGGYGKDHLRIENTVVGGRGRARVVTPIVRKTDNTYLITPHQLQSEVTEADYRNVPQPFDAEKDETIGLTTLLGLEKEYALASALQNSAVLTNGITLAGTSKFSDYNNSSPVNVFKNAQNAFLDQCGISANKAVMSKKVFNTLKYHPEILANLGYAMNRAGKLTIQEIADVIGVDEVIIGDASYNSAKEGQADVMTQVWGDSITLLFCPKTAAKYQQSIGYYITRQGNASRLVKKWDIVETFGHTGILVGDYYQFRLSDISCSYLIKSAI